MAPVLLSRAKGAFGGASTSVQAGLIMVIVFVSAAVVSVVLLLVFKNYRRKRQQQYESLSRPTSARLDNKGSAQRLAEHDELQRLRMIRKSLASRARSENQSPRRDFGRSDTDKDSPGAGSSNGDWKELEANIRSESMVSLNSHPALSPHSPSHALDCLCGSCHDASTPRPRTARLQHGVIRFQDRQRCLRPVKIPAKKPIRRDTLDSKTLPPRGTFDVVPEEYGSPGILVVDATSRRLT